MADHLYLQPVAELPSLVAGRMALWNAELLLLSIIDIIYPANAEMTDPVMQLLAPFYDKSVWRRDDLDRDKSWMIAMSDEE